MFATIASRYDLLNHLLSGNIDKRWRAVVAKELFAPLANREAKQMTPELSATHGVIGYAHSLVGTSTQPRGHHPSLQGGG